MSDAKINWYSISLNQKVEEHEPVDLKEAIRIVDRYLSNAGQKFKNDKEAIAATMFGFSKSRKDFIELCILGSDQFSHTFEFSNPQRTFGRIFRREEELHSKDELIKKVAEFFNTSSEEMATQYEVAKKQLKSPLLIPARASISSRVFTIIFLLIVSIFTFCMTIKCVFLGKIWFGQTHGGWVFRDQHPAAFLIFVALYLGISIWLIRGCMLELKIVQKMLSDREKEK